MLRPLAPLVLLLALATAAEACSLAREPPSPGAFYIWDLESAPVAVPVRDRGLGAMCELANRHALGDVFVHSAGHQGGARLLFFDLGGQPLGEARVPGSVQHLGVEGSVAYAVVAEHPEHMRVFRATPGDTQERSPLPGWAQALDGGVAIVAKDGQARAVDLETGRTIAGPVQAKGPGDAGLVAASRDWLVFEEWRREGPRLHVRSWDAAAWRTHDAAARGWQFALDGDTVVYGAYEEERTVLHRLDLRTGTDRVVASGPAQFLGVAHEGLVVLGAYSAPGLEGEWKVHRDLPGPSLLLALAAATWLAGPHRPRFPREGP